MTRKPSERLRHARVQELFLEARDQPADELADWLERSCGDDPSLRAEVESLLEHDRGAEGILDRAQPGLDMAAALTRSDEARHDDEPTLPERIGGHRILSLLGRGGMARVYRAQQEHPHRVVALKVLELGLDTRSLERRFEREVQLLGRLEHPGIASIFEAGRTRPGELGDRPRPWFAMELVAGRRLDEHAREASLDTRQRLELIVEVCDAVEHAHARGVVHRDLKPANIMVDTNGQPKVLDFGVARLTEPGREHVLQTRTGVVLGTLAYMSPEQVAGRAQEIDPRSDVYSLGVIAHELLSERRPYSLEGLALPEAARVICDEEPSSLGQQPSAWQADLETIVGKALEKQRERRYPSAGRLADDLRRLLRDEPISARPPSAAYRMKKFARRNKATVVGVVGIIAALAAGVVVSLQFALRAAERETEATRVTYRMSLAAAQSALREGDPIAGRHLDDAPTQLRGWEWHVLESQLDPSLRVLPKPEGKVHELSFGPEATTLRVVHGSGEPDDPRMLLVRDVESGALLQSSVLSPERPVRVRGEDLELARRHAIFRSGETELEYRELNTGVVLGRDRACGDVATRREVLALREDLAVLGTTDGNTHQRADLTCELSSGEVIAELEVPIVTFFEAELSPDGELLVGARDPTEMRVLDVATGRRVAQLRDTTDDVGHARFVGDGERLATVSWNGHLRLWDPRGGLLEKHRLAPTRLEHLVVGPDPSLLAVLGRQGLVRLWDLPTRSEVAVLPGSVGDVDCGVFSADGHLLATADSTAIRLWNVATKDDLAVLRGHESYVYPVVFSPDGARLYSGGWDQTVRAWDSETGQLIATLPTPKRISGLAVSPDGRRLVATNDDLGEQDTLLLFDTLTGRRLASRPGRDARWSSDSREVHANLPGSKGESRASALDPDTLEELRPRTPLFAGWLPSPGGAWRARVLGNGSVEIRATSDGRLAYHQPQRTGGEPGGGLAWSPDGSHLAVGIERDLVILRAPSWTMRILEEAHGRSVFALAFSPDGRLLASGGGDGVVRIWDAPTLEPYLELRGHDSYVWELAWSPDGAQLVSSSGDSTLRSWSSSPLSERWLAREERRRHLATWRPIVEALFGELGDAGAVSAAVRERSGGLTERERRAALDVVLQVSDESD